MAFIDSTAHHLITSALAPGRSARHRRAAKSGGEMMTFQMLAQICFGGIDFSSFGRIGNCFPSRESQMRLGHRPGNCDDRYQGFNTKLSHYQHDHRRDDVFLRGLHKGEPWNEMPVGRRQPL